MHSQLRRHRRKVLSGLVVLAVAAVAMPAHSALAGGGDHMSGAATICLTIGGCVAVIGVAAFAVRHLLQRPLWLISPPLAPTLPFIPVASGFVIRAGPPALSQVFRL